MAAQKPIVKVAPMTIYNPGSPFVVSLPADFGVSKRLTIVGTMTQDRFDINLLTGPNIKPRDVTALHFSIRTHLKEIVRNAWLKPNGWGTEERHGGCPIMPKAAFKILILVSQHSYSIDINGYRYCDFAFRQPHTGQYYIHLGEGAKVDVVTVE